MPALRGDGAAPLSQRLIRGGGWVLLGRAVALPVGLLQAMLLARVLAPAEVGAYFLAISLVIPLAIMSQLGLSRPMVKLVASALALERPNAARHAIRVAVPATLVVGSLLALGIADGPGRWLTSLLQDGERLRAALPILALMGLCFALIDLMAETLRGFHDLRAASAFGDFLVQRLLLVLALATLWLGGWPAEVGDVLTLALLAALLVLALAAGLLRRRLRALPRRGARFGTGEILRHSPPFLLVRLNVWITAGADLWVLGMFRPPEEVAVYGAASRMALLAGVPLMVCNAVLAPTVADLYSRRQIDRLEKVVRAAATMAAAPSALLVLLFVLFGDRLLGLLFTDAYRAGYPVLVCLALGQWVNVAFGSCAISLTMTGHQRDVMIASTVTAAATIVGFYLVAPYGTLAVALVVSASLVLYNLIVTLTARRRLGIATWTTLSLDAFRRFASELRRALGRPA
ncbi:MAG: polysaccharide biosynthesis protein [Geminicoccaceae bacterium]|nr:polysaccharide biosynthesis protein [Geminicoccaceae bacterium]